MKKADFWAKQYRSHIGKMVGTCYRYVGDWQVAEDLAQDAFLHAIEKSGTYHAWGSFEGWLKKIAVNEALMYLRNQPETVELDEGMAVEEPLADEPQEVKVDFLQEELLGVIRKLPVKQRTVFNLYAVEHWSHKQIAKKLDISVANSKVLLSRARAELQGMLAAMRVKKLRN
ncbi:MAG: sigma-70 family RNA polymerase sigma factor [Bacteroidales bacterium]|nr:sigma-70 family RNA polymerase sigma factor [Bacteroidales bacterium]